MNAALLAVLCALAPGQTRLAVIAGSNAGGEGRTPLRYAEADAARVKRALIEVAGVAEADVRLLKAPSAKELDEALSWAKQRALEVHATPGAKVVLFVYLSGHGHDGKGLELGRDVVEWEKLKGQVRNSGADVKVGIVDACNASGVLKVSGRSADDFELKAEDRLTVEGEAWITSSAENEPSVEAGAWRGSVFTHHLVAGLRGAADRSADRKVSLEELYRYAYERTTAGDSGQHPGYSFRLSGHGELDVSDPGKAQAIVTLPIGLDAVTVTERETGESLAEARHPLGRMLGLGPGRFDVRLLRGDQAYAALVELEKGGRVTLDESRLDKVATTNAQLVRLAAKEKAPSCFEVKVPRPDPRLLALKARLEGGCDKPQRATLQRGEKGTLRLELKSRVIEAGTDDELLKAAQATAL